MVAQATLLLFGSFFVMLLAGVPISAGIGIASIFTALFSMDPAIFALTAAQRCFSGIDSFSLLALPFFSLGGNIMNKGGIAKRLVRLARLAVGKMPGYLAATNVLANMFFGAVSGSSVAATSAMGSIMAPLELDEGYDPAVKIIIDAVPSLLAVIIVMGGILAGFFTATEAGVVLCLYCGLLSILYREMTFKSFYNLLADTMESSATILFLIAASSIMSYVMSYSGIPAAISNALMSVSSNRYVILLIMNVFLLVMGMFLDLTPAVLIFTPIFLPITRSIGMSDVQFGIMLIMNLGIGSVTPPVGSCLFVGCGVGKVKIEGVTKYIVPLFAAMVVALFLVTFIPAIALCVPYLCGLVPSLGWTF